MYGLVFVVLLYDLFFHLFYKVVFPFSYWPVWFICVSLSLPFILLLLSCFLPICMPKVEVCVRFVSVFTFFFFLNCYCYYNVTAKRSWRSSYWFKTHRPAKENLGAKREILTIVSYLTILSSFYFQLYKTAAANFLALTGFYIFGSPK